LTTNMLRICITLDFLTKRISYMENCELGCFGFDDVIMGGLDLMRTCRDGSGLVIDGDLQTVFVVEEE